MCMDQQAPIGILMLLHSYVNKLICLDNAHFSGSDMDVGIDSGSSARPSPSSPVTVSQGDSGLDDRVYQQQPEFTAQGAGLFHVSM